MFPVVSGESSAADRYIRSTTVCNALAVLVCKSNSSKDFVQRLAVLVYLRNCWTKGHGNVAVSCSSKHEDAGINADFVSMMTESYAAALSADSYESFSDTRSDVSIAKLPKSHCSLNAQSIATKRSSRVGAQQSEFSG